MAGFLDVLLRGAILVLTSLVLGGVVWSRLVLRAGPGRPPAGSTTLALRVVVVAAGLAALAQTSTLLVALTELRTAAGWPLAEFLETSFAVTALTRIALALTVGYLARRLSRGPAGPLAWHALGAGAVLLVVSSAVLSHAVAARGRPRVAPAARRRPPNGGGRVDRRARPPDGVRRVPGARGATTEVCRSGGRLHG